MCECQLQTDFEICQGFYTRDGRHVSTLCFLKKCLKEYKVFCLVLKSFKERTLECELSTLTACLLHTNTYSNVLQNVSSKKMLMMQSSSSPTATPSLSQHMFPSHELCIWLIRLIFMVYGQLDVPLCSSSKLKWTLLFFLPPSLLPSLSAVCYGWEGGPWVFVVPLRMLHGVAQGNTMK